MTDEELRHVTAAIGDAIQDTCTVVVDGQRRVDTILALCALGAIVESLLKVMGSSLRREASFQFCESLKDAIDTCEGAQTH